MPNPGNPGPPAEPADDGLPAVITGQPSDYAAASLEAEAYRLGPGDTR
jgi:hypothetical protein